MNISEIKIGGRRYRVEEWDQADANDRGRCGEIIFRTGTIRLHDGLSADNMAETLLHEILHGVFHDMSMDWSDDEEERMIGRLSPRLAALFADNPEQVRELVRVLER